MWRPAAGLAQVQFRAPVPPADPAEAERRLGGPLPGQLVALLRESDGIEGPYGEDLVWPLSRIVADNLHFWSDRSLAELYMPFTPLLFFGDDGGGDQFAFVRTPARPDVFVWEHEDDSRRWVARDLRDHLSRTASP
ncbi:SMI1/KNR4 family protein [Streptomyces cavernicola]|uniref:SMI1/KNR4 family protein n=1 Tax=Streptomyces cavernicola TaxID=3043613 RepID=A0ABT6SA53_9ACTN|nr:SMI1/KNR4 family protein [Streptomyces sp. B-S-A6]MDI3405055.1 SMI1/KNR4 family protein [Streptomyces sp. B-S-A6]